MGANAVDLRFNEVHPELIFRHQKNFVLHKQISDWSTDQIPGSGPYQDSLF